MTCIFCDIATGRPPAHIAWQTRRLTVFADHAPIRPGHMQIIPRAHYATFDELPPDIAAEIVWLGQAIAQAQKALYGVTRVGFVFTGNDVAHCHAHVLPLHESTDITSLQYFPAGTCGVPKPQRADPSDLETEARKLARALAAREPSKLLGELA